MADKLEERTRAEIDTLLAAAGWSVQFMSEAKVHGARKQGTFIQNLNIVA